MAKNQNRKPQKIKVVRINFSWIYLLLIAGIIFMLFSSRGVPAQKIEWAQLEEMIKAGDIKEVQFVRNDFKGDGTVRPDRMSKYSELFPGGKVPASAPQFFFLTSSKFDPELEFARLNAFLEPQDRTKLVITNDAKIWENVLEWVFPLLLFILLWVWMFRGMGRNAGGGPGAGGMNPFNAGKTQGKEVDKDKVNVTFKDVAGLYGAKEEVMEIVDFLKNPQKYTSLGGKIPKGALLVGPPGTGKTLLAKAVAGEANVPFFSMSGSDFVEMFVGVGASRVRDLFAQAKAKAPCIVFIDEIDAVGRARGKNAGWSSNDERENTLNQLLTEMDGFGTNSGVIVLAATNRADVLDKALLRAGRFDRQIYVELPDLDERKAIFGVHMKKLKLGNDIDNEFLAKQTAGFSGADIANVCNEAALVAARKAKEAIEKQDFLDAIDRIIMGLEKRSKVISDEEKKMTSVHEVGHAVVNWLLRWGDPLVKVTIVPRGRALGATWYLPEERALNTREKMLDSICTLMAGRAAEEVFFNTIDTGALNDMERATKMAQSMVIYYGMSEKVGNISYYDSTGQADWNFTKPFSEKTAETIDNEVRSIVEEAYARAKQIIVDNRAKIEQLADILYDREVIFKEDVENIFGPRPWDEEKKALAEKKQAEAEGKTEETESEVAEAVAETTETAEKAATDSETTPKETE